MMDKIIGISILIQCIYARLDITRRGWMIYGIRSARSFSWKEKLADGL
jgi:hypothetical protein